MYSSYSVAAAVCSVIFPVLASFAVALRFRARSIKGQRYGVDDYLALLALAFAIALCCIVFYGAFAASIGQDLSTITPSEYTSYSKHIYFTPICAYPAYGLAKISVLEFYKRIFITNKFRLSANITITFVVLWMVTAELVQIFSAWPIDQFWTFGGHFDLNFGAQALAFACLDITLDIITLCLPLPVIRSLHMDRKHKFILIGIFWLGIFCVVAASVRLYFTYELSFYGNAAATSSSWFSYVSVNTLIWGEIESCCSIIAACLPSYGALLQGSQIVKKIGKAFSSVLNASMFSSRRTQQSGASAFSLTRARTASEAVSEQGTSSIEVEGKWYPLSDRIQTIVSQDVERGSIKNSKNIRVDKSFMTQVENS